MFAAKLSYADHRKSDQSKAMTAITIKEYYAENGSPWSHADARKIGPILYEMSKERGVTARDVLDSARSTNSPLHEYFEWNDQVAADKFRLEQARSMLKSVRVRYIENDQPREARAFQVSKSALYESEPRKYRSFQVLHGDSAFAAQMMENAVDDLVSWRRRYEPYSGMWLAFGDVFQGVVNQIGELQDEYATKNLAGETDDGLAQLLEWKAQFADMLATWTECREQVGYIMEAIGEAESAFARLKDVARRSCVKCGTQFATLDDGMHTCPACRKNLTYKTASQRVLPSGSLAKQLSADG